MEKETLKALLKEKKDIICYTKEVYEDKSLIAVLLDIMENDKTAIKFQAEKVIRKISEEKPILIYPYFERIGALLDSKNSFIRLGAILTIPNLLSVDSEHLWKKIRDRYLQTYRATSISEFGNGIKGIEKILDAYPEEENTIIPLLLSIENHIFLHKGEQSHECLNVARGQIIGVFDELYESSFFKSEMILFADENKNNERKTVKAKAEKFLMKHIK